MNSITYFPSCFLGFVLMYYRMYAELYMYCVVLYCIHDVLISRYVIYYLNFCTKDRGASFSHFGNFIVMILQSDIPRTMVLINLNSINVYKNLFNINLFTD